jgi:hypothetical protein
LETLEWRESEECGEVNSTVPVTFIFFKCLLIIISASILQALFYGMELLVVLKECQSQRKSDEFLTDVIPFIKKKEELCIL